MSVLLPVVALGSISPRNILILHIFSRFSACIIQNLLGPTLHGSMLENIWQPAFFKRREKDKEHTFESLANFWGDRISRLADFMLLTLNFQHFGELSSQLSQAGTADSILLACHSYNSLISSLVLFFLKSSPLSDITLPKNASVFSLLFWGPYPKVLGVTPKNLINHSATCYVFQTYILTPKTCLHHGWQKD